MFGTFPDAVIVNVYCSTQFNRWKKAYDPASAKALMDECVGKYANMEITEVSQTLKNFRQRFVLLKYTYFILKFLSSSCFLFIAEVTAHFSSNLRGGVQ